MPALEQNEILEYLVKNCMDEEVCDIYTRARVAKIRYFQEDDYYFTSEDRYNTLMLASAWSAALRKTYRLFVKDMGFKRNSFWGAFIKFNIFHQHVLFDKRWEDVFKADKEWRRLIKKTHNAKFVEKMFHGDINTRWLYRELEKTWEDAKKEAG